MISNRYHSDSNRHQFLLTNSEGDNAQFSTTNQKHQSTNHRN